MKPLMYVAGLFMAALIACTSNGKPVESDSSTVNNIIADTVVSGTPATGSAEPTGAIADAATIMARKQVPVLCYHHIKELTASASSILKTYSVTPEGFAAQMKMLSDSGYHTVLPDQLYNYLAYGTALPDKPVMLTFDDTDGEQYTLGAKEMKKYGFKGVFFIMTISINRPRYMSKEQIKELADDGHEIACHTWDHHMVTKYTGDDWQVQLEKPRKTLEEITGKPVRYFAYPFGLWNEAAITEIKKRDYKLAFILSTKRDTTQPLYTVRRIIVPSSWSASGLLRSMNASFP